MRTARPWWSDDMKHTADRQKIIHRAMAAVILVILAGQVITAGRLIHIKGADRAAQAEKKAADAAAPELELTPDQIERDYTKVMYDSGDGLNGSTAISMYADRDGLLWVGSYTGMYRYDGYEFEEVPLADPIVGVTAITQDQDGRIWAGTNGDGIFVEEDGVFVRIDPENGTVNSVHAMVEDGADIIYAATTEGVYRVEETGETEEGKTGYVTPVAGLEGIEVRDLAVVNEGHIVAVTSGGDVYLIRDMAAEQYDLSPSGFSGEVRCAGSSYEQDVCYLGTGGNAILKYSWEGEYLKTIECEDLSSFNAFYPVNSHEWWVCSDAGIGLMQVDKVRKMNLPMNDSVEDVCIDYQGGYWFASSRQGVMKLYENRFSDLGSYLGIPEVTVNAVYPYEGGYYLGCDGGLKYFKGKKEQEDALTEACAGMRIRHITDDSAGNIWVSTYRDGIACRHPDGEITWYQSNNSALETDKIRCTYEISDGRILAGTDAGMYQIDQAGTLSRFAEDDRLCQTRVMTILEDQDGTVYAGTDGYGIYIIRDETVQRVLTKKDGLLTDVVMRLTSGKDVAGIWIVTGAGICYYDPVNDDLRAISGLTVANSLDLLVRENGKVCILAGNGVFVLDEADLLEGNDLAARHYTQHEGLPIDITANSWNVFSGDELIICGSGGLAAFHMDYEHIQKDVKLYAAQISADDEPLQAEEGVYTIGANISRLTLDIRPVLFNAQAVRIGHQLVGQDEEMRFVRALDLEKAEYTNLPGGDYQYVVSAVDPVTGAELDRMEISLTKVHHFWEVPAIRILMIVCALAALAAITVMLLIRNSRRLHGHYQNVLQTEREKLQTRMQYRDVVTGVYNRDLFEQEKAGFKASELFAIMIIGLNNISYIRYKYTIKYETDLLIHIAGKMRAFLAEERGVIYRVHEDVFAAFIQEPCDAEGFISSLREEMRALGEGSGHMVSISAGLVYCEEADTDNLEELIEQCSKQRKLDESLEEGRFFEEKLSGIED